MPRLFRFIGVTFGILGLLSILHWDGNLLSVLSVATCVVLVCFNLWIARVSAIRESLFNQYYSTGGHIFARQGSRLVR